MDYTVTVPRDAPKSLPEPMHSREAREVGRGRGGEGDMLEEHMGSISKDLYNLQALCIEEFQRRIQAKEMRCYRKILHI